MAAHYAFGATGGPATLVLRSRAIAPVAAAGTSMSLVVDEGVNTALGLTPPPHKFPLPAHLSGSAAHAVDGLGLGLLLGAGDER